MIKRVYNANPDAILLSLATAIGIGLLLVAEILIHTTLN
jgi:hypothetical protein